MPLDHPTIRSASAAAKHKQMSRVWVLLRYTLGQGRQAVELLAHVGDTSCKPNPRVGRNRDHAINPSTKARTPESAVGPSTKIRRPSDKVMSNR